MNSTSSRIFTRFVSSATRATRPATRFPTLHNPQRSGNNPKILVPKGHLVYNPAPAVPSPYITPAVFLPRGVERQTAPSKEYPVEVMPAIRGKHEKKQTGNESSKKYNLTEQDLIEIEKLRTSEPFKWTRKKLAKKFNCSEFMIGVASKPAQEYKQAMDSRLEEIKGTWSARTLRARKDRYRRKKLWVRDA